MELVNNKLSCAAVTATSALLSAGPSAGGAPTWSSDETWIAYADGWDTAFATGTLPDTTFKTVDAYVTQGTLVWDMRALGLQTPGTAELEQILARLSPSLRLSARQR